MTRLLVLLLASPDTDEGRQRGAEALRLTETLAGTGEPPVTLLLQGDGVLWLREPGEPAITFEVLAELGVPVAACTLAVRERGLERVAHERGVVVTPAVTRLAAAVSKGWQVVSF